MADQEQQTSTEHPFSDADVQRLLEEERDDSKESGWKLVHKEEFVETWRKSEDTHAVHLVKGFLKFPDIPVDAVVELTTNIEVRKKWDHETFPHVEIVEKHDGYVTVYWQFKMPIGVTDRDLLQYMWIKKDETINTTYVIYKDASHPEVPEKKDFIRTETIFSGLIIRPDPDDPKSTKMTMLIQNDAKGLIPKFAINFVTTKVPEKWRSCLEKHYRDTQK